MSQQQQRQALPALLSQDDMYEAAEKLLKQAEGELNKSLCGRLYNGMNTEVVNRDAHIAALKAEIRQHQSNLAIILKDPTNAKIHGLSKDLERMADRLAEAERLLQVSPPMFPPRRLHLFSP